MITENQYTSGFNSGYLLTKYKSDLVNTFIKNLSSTGDFFQGFFAGKVQIELENLIIQIDELKSIRNKDIEIEKNIVK